MLWCVQMKIMCPNLENHMNRNVSFNFVCVIGTDFFFSARFTFYIRLLSPGALELSEALLSMDPLKRPTAAKALEFSYFKTESPEPVMPAK
jgi:hypothetical protein